MSRTESVRSFKSVPDLLDNLPDYVKCQNDYTRRPLCKPKREALRYKYIQPTNKIEHYFILDCDNNPLASLKCIRDLGINPAWIAMNRGDNRFHCAIELEDPVTLHANSRMKPIRFANDVYDKLVVLTGADKSWYRFNYTKNPLHFNYILEPAYPFKKSKYQLTELAALAPWQETLDGLEDEYESGLGGIFNKVRDVAYAHVEQYKRHKTYEDFLGFCAVLCMKASKNFTTEKIDWLAEYIADWCWKFYTGEGGLGSRFSKEQNSKGGVRSGITRREIAKPIDLEILELHKQDYNNTEIARQLNVDRGKVYRAIKRATTAELPWVCKEK